MPQKENTMPNEEAMTQEERRIRLIRALCDEDPAYRDLTVPEDETGQRRLLRSLMNVRPPRPVSDDFLALQDAYLSRETKNRGIVDGAALTPTSDDPRIVLWQGDITRLKTDAIVNAANSALLGCFQPCHSCIDNIIHTCAGIQLRLACHALMTEQGHEEPTGTAKITPAFNLPCRYVLHTVGPTVTGPLTQRHKDQLAACYTACLELAAQKGLTAVAFCCISTGVFAFPREEAAAIAVDTVRGFLNNNPASIQQVIFNVFKDEDLAIYQNILS